MPETTGIASVDDPLDGASNSGGENSNNGLKDARAAQAIRRRLPDERRSLMHHFSIGGQEGYVIVGLYEDGLPGEVFIRMAKEGSSVSGLMDSLPLRCLWLCSTECRCDVELTIKAVMRSNRLSEGNQKKLQPMTSE